MYPNMGDITPTMGEGPRLKKEEEESRASAFIFPLFPGAMLTVASCPYCHDFPDRLHPQTGSKETLCPSVTAPVWHLSQQWQSS